MKKRLICVWLTVVLLLSAVTPLAGAITDSDMSHATALTLGETADAFIEHGGGGAYFCYTPGITCVYAFYSSGSGDARGYLYSRSGDELARDDDSGEGKNFRVVCELEADQTYYFRAEYYNSTAAGTIPVTLELIHNWGEGVSDQGGKHTHTCSVCHATKTEDCTYNTVTENGIAKHTCTECGYSYSEEVGFERTLAFWGFEDDADGWTFLDRDGDGNNWSRCESNAYEGSYAIRSAYNATESVDQWAISPAFSLEGKDSPTLSVWLRSGNPSYQETFTIYAGTSLDPNAMVQITDDFIADTTYRKYTADLSDYYDEQTVYIAIRHYQSQNTMYLYADNVTVTYYEPLNCDNHVLVTVPAAAATCTERGHSADYWQCENCGRTYSDAQGNHPALLSDLLDIPAAGHSWSAPVWNWANDYSSATATFTCSRCHDEEIENAAVTSTAYADRTEYTAAVNFGGASHTDTKTVYGKKYFVGHSLSLNGDIGVNFYVDLSDQELASGATVDFVWTVNNKQKTHSVDLSADDHTKNGYMASCPVAVAEITYPVTATLKMGDQRITDTYSAVQYADVILNDEDFIEDYIEEYSTGKYLKLTALVKAMLSYGAKAQVQFDRDQENPADKDIDYDQGEVTSETVGDTGASDMTDGLAAYGLEYKASTIVYLSQTSIRHYYEIKNPTEFEKVSGNITFNGSPVSYKTKGDEIYFELPDIAAKDLDTLYTLKIGEHEYKYSVLQYVKECLDSTNTGANMKELAKATYRYNQAANAYFG